MSDLTLSQNPSPLYTPGENTTTTGTGTNKTTTTTPTTGTTAPGTLLGYLDNDTLGSSSTQFITTLLSNLTSSNPNLPPPTQPGEEPPPTPYNSTDQATILTSYKSDLSTTIQNMIGAAVPPLSAADAATLTQFVQQGGGGALTGQLAEIYNNAVKSAEGDMMVEYNLNADWTPDTSTPEGWTPEGSNVSVPQPYDANGQAGVLAAYQNDLSQQVTTLLNSAPIPLPTDQVNALTQAVQEGGEAITALTGQAAIIFSQANATAISDMKATYGLPDSWTPSSTSTTDWTPIASTGVNATDNTNISGTVGNNVITVNEQIKSALEGLISQVPPNGAASTVLADFLKAVASAIDTLKQTLSQLQITLSQREDDLDKAKFSAMSERRDALTDLENTQQKNIDAEHQSHGKGGLLGEIMKIITPIIAAIVIVVGALTSPLGFGAPLVIAGAILLAYSIADSATPGGITSRMVDAISKLGSPMNYVVGAIVAAVVVGICIASGNIGEGASIVAQVIAETAVQASMAIAVPALIASGAVQALISDIASACGASGEELQMISNITAMVLIVGVMVVAGGKGGGKTMAQEAGATLKQAAADFKAGLNAAVSDVEESATSLLSRIQNYDITNLPADIGNGIKDAATAAVKNLVAGFKNLLSKEGVLLILQAAPAAINIASNVIQYQFQMLEAKLQKQIGDIQGEIQTISTMIKQLEKLENAISAGIGDPSEWMNQLDQMLSGMYDKTNQSLTGLAQAG